MSPCAALTLLLCLVVSATNAAVCPNLGIAENFALIAASTITNTGFTVIDGNLAISPGIALTGFPPGEINGAVQLGTAVALQAHNDAIKAYNYIKDVPYITDMTGVELSGVTLTPGVYHFNLDAGILTAGGILTLDGKGIYIFQVGTTLTTAANTKVVLKNGAMARCIFWQLGSSATLGASSLFMGNILAYASLTLGYQVTYSGSIYAQTGAITLIDDVITHDESCDVVCSVIPNLGD